MAMKGRQVQVCSVAQREITYVVHIGSLQLRTSWRLLMSFNAAPSAAFSKNNIRSLMCRVLTSYQVKNRAPAPIQITAEQILREASDRREKEQKAPRRIITNKEELDQYRLHKRKDYEDSIRRQRHHLGTWVKYAQWEESQGDFARARSVFERALDVDYKSQTLWLKYAEVGILFLQYNHCFSPAMLTNDSGCRGSLRWK